MWEVIGFETQEDDAGQVTAYTVHLTKEYRAGGTGKRSKRIWYRKSEHTYEPVVGQTVMVETEVRGKFEALVDIYPV